MKSIAKQIPVNVLAPITVAGVKYAPGAKDVSLPKHDVDYLVTQGAVSVLAPAPETEATAEVVHNPDTVVPHLEEVQEPEPTTEPETDLGLGEEPEVDQPVSAPAPVYPRGAKRKGR